MVGPYGRTLEYLASNTDRHRRNATWRCLALFFNATITSTPAMGEHCPVPQAHSMAMLLDNGTHDQIA